MPVSPYLNFPGTCREALSLYKDAFGSPEPQIMSFGDLPPGAGAPPDPAAKNLVMHAELLVEGGKLMFSDLPPGMPFSRGDNISVMVSFEDRARLEKAWKRLLEGGTVGMELGPQFWSPLYGYLTDRFGVGWQLSLEGSGR